MCCRCAWDYSVFLERYLVRFPVYRIPVPYLPEEFVGLPLVHITDIHYGILVPLPCERLVHQIKMLEKVSLCVGRLHP
jgi:predicted MPP superfamily phosphohydrolase